MGKFCDRRGKIPRREYQEEGFCKFERLIFVGHFLSYLEIPDLLR